MGLLGGIRMRITVVGNCWGGRAGHAGLKIRRSSLEVPLGLNIPEDHPLLKGTRVMRAQAFVDLATAIHRADVERIEVDRLNIVGFREQAAFVFGLHVRNLDFAVLCDALAALVTSSDKPDC